MTHQFLVLKLIQREAEGRLRTVIILLHIGDDARSHHQLHIGGRGGAFGVLVFCFEIIG